MSNALSTFMSIAQECAPYAVIWAICIKVFRFVVGVVTGKDVELK